MWFIYVIIVNNHDFGPLYFIYIVINTLNERYRVCVKLV